jgi:ribose 5-phosphate isomerase RpiB
VHWISCRHGVYKLKVELALALRNYGYEIKDFGTNEFVPDDDYPDFVFSLAMAVANGN